MFIYIYVMLYIKYHDWRSEKYIRIRNVEVKQSMGVYFNPSNGSFTQARNSQIFMDKTGLIEFLK